MFVSLEICLQIIYFANLPKQSQTISCYPTNMLIFSKIVGLKTQYQKKTSKPDFYFIKMSNKSQTFSFYSFSK